MTKLNPAEWTRLPNGCAHWTHPVYGAVYLNEDYGRTFRANPKPNCGFSYENEIRTPGTRWSKRFRSREAAMLALVKLHEAKKGN